MLMGISLFLCNNELLYLNFSNMAKEFGKEKANEGIISIVFKVKRKSDHKPTYLILKRNKGFFKLCLVQHLLVCIKSLSFELSYCSLNSISRTQVGNQGYITTCHSLKLFEQFVPDYSIVLQECILTKHTFSVRVHIYVSSLAY